MSDDKLEDEKRPNANYNLSNQNSTKNEKEGLVFYYNREKRLENSPEAVKKLYRNEKPVRFSLFGPLVADRPRRVLFVIIVLMCGGILTLLFTGYFDITHELDGNKIEISSVSYEGNTIITLKKTAQKKDAYTGAVDIAIAPEDSDLTNIFYHRIFFSLENIESYKFVAPYDTPELLMVIHLRFRHPLAQVFLPPLG